MRIAFAADKRRSDGVAGVAAAAGLDVGCAVAVVIEQKTIAVNNKEPNASNDRVVLRFDDSGAATAELMQAQSIVTVV